MKIVHCCLVLLVVLIAMVHSQFTPSTMGEFTARFKATRVYWDGRPTRETSGTIMVDRNAQLMRIDGDMDVAEEPMDVINIYQGGFHWRIMHNATVNNITCELHYNESARFVNTVDMDHFKGVRFWQGRLVDVWEEVPLFGAHVEDGKDHDHDHDHSVVVSKDGGHDDHDHKDVDKGPATYFQDHFDQRPVGYFRNTTESTYTLVFSDYGDEDGTVAAFTMPRHFACDLTNENDLSTIKHIPPMPSMEKDWETSVAYSSADKKITGSAFFATSHDAQAVHWQGDYWHGTNLTRDTEPSDVSVSVYHDGKLTEIRERAGMVKCSTTRNDTNPWGDLFSQAAYKHASYAGMTFLNNGVDNTRLVEIWKNVSLPTFGSVAATDTLYIDAFTKNPVRLAVDVKHTLLYVNFYNVITHKPINADLFVVSQHLKCTGPSASGVRVPQSARMAYFHSVFEQSVEGVAGHNRTIGRLFVDRDSQFMRSDNSILEGGHSKAYQEVHLRRGNVEYTIKEVGQGVDCVVNSNVSQSAFVKDPFASAHHHGVAVKHGHLVDVWDNVHPFPHRPGAAYVSVEASFDLFTHDLVQLEFATEDGKNVTLKTSSYRPGVVQLNEAVVKPYVACRAVATPTPSPTPAPGPGAVSSGEGQPSASGAPATGMVDPGTTAGISAAMFVVGMAAGGVAYHFYGPKRRAAVQDTEFDHLDA